MLTALKVKRSAVLITIVASLIVSISLGLRAAEENVSSMFLLKPVVTLDGFFHEKFAGPTGIYVDGEAEEVYVADPAKNSISIFATDGTPLFKFGKEKGLIAPYDLVVRKGLIYVSQASKDYVEIFSYRGDSLGRLALPDGIPFIPGRLAIDEKGNIYVLNSAATNCVVFDRGGVFKGTIGEGLKSLSGITVKGDRLYLITPMDIPAIRIFDTSGGFVSGFGFKGEGADAVGVPVSVEVDKEGRIWIVDAVKGIILYNSEGTELGRIREYAPGRYFFPIDIDFDLANRLYLIEKEGTRLRAFELAE